MELLETIRNIYNGIPYLVFAICIGGTLLVPVVAVIDIALHLIGRGMDY